jgi:hypothetical protein
MTKKYLQLAWYLMLKLTKNSSLKYEIKNKNTKDWKKKGKKKF